MGRLRLLALAAALLCHSTANAEEAKPTEAYNAAGPGQLVVSTCAGKPCLRRDGAGPYRPKGLIIEGLSAAASSWQLLTPVYREMARKLSFETILAVRRFGADSVRYNIAQVNLDPKSSYYNAGYSGLVVSYVQYARSLGLTVLVEINDEQPPDSGRLGHASEATNRAWQELLPKLSGDQGIMLGAYNEPTLTATKPGELAAWKSSYDSVVAAIRAAGAKNVIVVDGPSFGQQLTPQLLSYPIADSAHNLVYGVHPFPQGKMAFPTGWPDLFEKFCLSKDVLCQLTAWNIFDKKVNGYEVKACPAEAPEASQRKLPDIAQQLLDTAKRLNSGVYGWAFDYPNVIMDSAEPMSKTVGLDDFVDCRHMRHPWGGGELLKRDFADPNW